MKILRKILFVIILSILLILVFRNALFKAIITNYIEKTFKGNCAIKSASISLKKVSIGNLKFSNKNVSFRLEDVSARINFSFKKIVRGNVLPTIKNIDVSDCDVYCKGFRIDNLNVKDTGTNLYTLRILRLTIKDKEIKEIFIPLRVEKNKLIFGEVRNVFFGHNARLDGVLEFTESEFTRLNLGLKRVSFENLMRIASNDITLKGLFEGKMNVCLAENKVSEIEGTFYNNEGGVIHINQEQPLDLQKYLDSSTRATLIDSFKNYAYNVGVIRISKKKNGLLFSVKFNSEKMGKRNITINFHNILGGEGR